MRALVEEEAATAAAAAAAAAALRAILSSFGAIGDTGVLEPLV